MTPAKTLALVLLGSTLALAPRCATGQVVTTLAGSGAVGNADGVGTSATFDHPGPLAVDLAGNVYVAQHAAVRKITPAGVVTTLAIPVTWPSALATDAAGNLWVVDQANGHPGSDHILRLAPDGRVTKVADSPTTWGLSGLAFDASGNLIIADPGDWVEGTGGGRILKLTPGGSFVALTGPGTPFKLDDPTKVAVDSAGNLYVAGWRGSVLELGVDGATTTLASGLATYPSGGITLDRAGDVYVSDILHDRVVKIPHGGGVTVVAGTGIAGSLDGPGEMATFNGPSGLGLDGVGNLYVADTGNNRVRKIALGAACGAGCGGITVPSVARTHGPNGSFWTSSLTVHNRNASPVTIAVKFLGHDADGTDGPEREVTLGPSQTITYADVLASVFGLADGFGALQVRAGPGVVARSRTSTISSGGTIGDGIPGVPLESLFTDRTAPPPVLTGLREDASFRTHLILVNASATPLTVLVTAFDSSGAPLCMKTRALRPYEMTQDAHFLAGAEFGVGPKSDVTVAVSTSTPGGAYTACAIVIDNASNAPATVLPQ